MRASGSQCAPPIASSEPPTEAAAPQAKAAELRETNARLEGSHKLELELRGQLDVARSQTETFKRLLEVAAPEATAGELRESNARLDEGRKLETELRGQLGLRVPRLGWERCAGRNGMPVPRAALVLLAAAAVLCLQAADPAAYGGAVAPEPARARAHDYAKTKAATGTITPDQSCHGQDGRLKRQDDTADKNGRMQERHLGHLVFLFLFAVPAVVRA